MQYSRDCITITSNNLFFHFQKHPHLRGENLEELQAKLRERVLDSITAGNIPTCVGKTGAVEADGVTDEETSPPAWGKLKDETVAVAGAGNIPTCVGKTSRSCKLRISCWKHPHLRGENFVK